MRILVVDNGQRAAVRLGQALRALGQEAVLSPDPAHAIEAARRLALDAVLVDTELSSSQSFMTSGVDFAEALWLFDRCVLVGFRLCGRDESIDARAAALGPVFPARWTMNDIERVVAELGHRMSLNPAPVRDVAQGRQVGMEDGASRPGDPLSQPVVRQAGTRGARGAWLLVPAHRFVRRIKVACRTWAQVETLCDQRDAGKDFLTLRGSHDLEPEERLSVTLHLPGALTVSIAAQVTSSRWEGTERIHVIRLVGFTPERCARLRAMAVSASQPLAVSPAAVDRAPAQPAAALLPEPDSRHDAGHPAQHHTRHQIDRLADNMQPSPGRASGSPLPREPRGRG